MDDTNHLFAIGCAERAATRTAAVLHRDFNRGTSTLSLIARVAPLLGALGTTVGAIQAITLYHVSSFDYSDVAGGPADAFVLFALSLPVAMFAWGGSIT